jgi:acid phosphatase (class A)
MKKKLWIILAICGMTVFTSCEDLLDGLLDSINDNPVPSSPGYNNDATIPDSVYVAAVNQPSATYYMPKPPAQSDVDFSDDEIQWKWGITQRGTDRGATAKEHMGRTPKTMCKIMAKVLGINSISKEETPALERLLHRAYRTGEQSAMKTKSYYNRQRPFVIMGESAWYEPDAQNVTGSYVSATTAAGWAVGLVFAEMWPPLQNKVLRKAFQFGEDRVISGSNFQSDVEGGYLSGAASIAMAHNDPKLQQDITDAREEYKKLKGLASSYNPVIGINIPEGVQILNIPITTSDNRHQADLKRYYDAKKYRDTERGAQAVMDAESSSERMANVFGNTLGITINPTNTPAIYQLLQLIRPHNSNICTAVKLTYFRLRPFALLGEQTPLPAKEYSYAQTSTYPSGHACYAWAVALVLAEVAPDRQNQLLARAYDFGYNRVIVGFHWPTDVDAGRLLASSLVAYMHTNDDTRRLIKEAQAEYKKYAQ